MLKFASALKSRFTLILLLPLLLVSHTLLAETSDAAQEPTTKVLPTKPVETASDRLNLSPEQRKAYEDAMQEVRENMHANMKLHDEISQAMYSDKYDESSVRSMIQKHHQQTEDTLVKSSKAMNDFYKSLSPEQKKNFDEIQQKKRERMKTHHEERINERREERGKKAKSDK